MLLGDVFGQNHHQHETKHRHRLDLPPSHSVKKQVTVDIRDPQSVKRSKGGDERGFASHAGFSGELIGFCPGSQSGDSPHLPLFGSHPNLPKTESLGFPQGSTPSSPWFHRFGTLSGVPGLASICDCCEAQRNFNAMMCRAQETVPTVRSAGNAMQIFSGQKQLKGPNDIFSDSQIFDTLFFCSFIAII